MQKILNFVREWSLQRISSRFHKKIKTVHPPYNSIIPSLFEIEWNEYSGICNLYYKNKTNITKYSEWRITILERLRKNNDKNELINFSHYLRLIQRNYEATVFIPGHIIEILFGLVVGAFLGWDQLTNIEKSIPVLGGIIACICLFEIISIIFSSTKRMPVDFCNDIIEIIELRCQELEMIGEMAEYWDDLTLIQQQALIKHAQLFIEKKEVADSKVEQPSFPEKSLQIADIKSELS